MFLSNPCLFFLLFVPCLLLFQACGASPTNDNRTVSVNGISSDFPFSTREPEVYQGDFIFRHGQVEDKWFVARKGGFGRLDFFENGELSHSRITADNIYFIDHKRKVYFVPEEDKALRLPQFDSFGDMAHSFFLGKEYREFDEIERANGIVKYKVKKTAGSKDEILISIDETSGLMVRQEFASSDERDKNGSQPALVYEVINLKTVVDDSVFSVPVGYRKVARDEYIMRSN